MSSNNINADSSSPSSGSGSVKQSLLQHKVNNKGSSVDNINAAAAAATATSSFRNYDCDDDEYGSVSGNTNAAVAASAAKMQRVLDHYRDMRTFQTVAFYEKMSQKYSFAHGAYRRRMTIEQAFEELEGYVVRKFCVRAILPLL